MDTESRYNEYIELIQTKLSKDTSSKIINFIRGINGNISFSPLNPHLYENYCYKGGYIDSVFKLVDFADKFHNTLSEYKELDYSYDDLMFCCVTYNLGKVTDGKKLRYTINKNDWQITNKKLKYIDNIDYMLDRDRTLKILSDIDIKLSTDIYLTILLQDWYTLDSNLYYIENGIKFDLPHIFQSILFSSNLIMSKQNNSDMEQEVVAKDISKVNMKRYNRTKRLNQNIKLDIKI